MPDNVALSWNTAALEAVRQVRMATTTDAVGPGGSPSAVGVEAAAAVLAFRHGDGANSATSTPSRAGRPPPTPTGPATGRSTRSWSWSTPTAGSPCPPPTGSASASWPPLGPGRPFALEAGWELRPRLGPRPQQGRGVAPYLPTPPFGEFPSGHSTFSAAAAMVLTCFTGSDRFGPRRPCRRAARWSSRASPRPPTSSSPWPTLTDAAGQAGRSRRDGGIHKAGDLVGRVLGATVGARCWRAAAELFEGGRAGPAAA